jgi:hypothetical protein
VKKIIIISVLFSFASQIAPLHYILPAIFKSQMKKNIDIEDNEDTIEQQGGFEKTKQKCTDNYLLFVYNKSLLFISNSLSFFGHLKIAASPFIPVYSIPPEQLL